jgi:predicted transcriptional regulator
MSLDPSNPHSYQKVDVPMAVIRCKDLKTADKIVYAAIAAALQLKIRPTLETLSRETRLCAATVNVATKRLAAAGFIQRRALPGSGGLVLNVLEVRNDE